jgi:antirestriction protein
MSRVYVGTYRKYNEGSIAGEWLELEDYDSRADFYEACRELHSDEADPELMFQDWEEIPEKYITESSIDDDLWDWLKLPAVMKVLA